MSPEELQAAGFGVTADAHARLERFVERLVAENRRLNLTGIREPRKIWALHVCDSLALLPLLDALSAGSVLDLGTGGGVPGLPLACCRGQVNFTLVDATRKKVEAVARIAAALGLANVRCVWGRGERLWREPQHRRRYDALVARAVARLPELVGTAAGFVRAGGRCWFLKSTAAVPGEVSAAEARAHRHGLRYLEAVRYRLPDGCGERLVVVYEKRA